MTDAASRTTSGVVIVMALAAAFGAGVGARRFFRRDDAAPTDLARAFLIDYHQVLHETFDHERPFARLRRCGQANVAAIASDDAELARACDEFTRIGAATLRRFASRARRLGERRAAAAIERLTHDVERLLAETRHAPPSAIADMMTRLFERMTALAGACAGAYARIASRAPCRAGLEISEALAAKLAHLERQGIQVRVSLGPPGGEPVLFEPAALRSLVAELIENAARAVQDVAHPEILVSLTSVAADSRWLVLRVADNGPGISRDRREGVLAGTDSHRGTDGGFGLAHARATAASWLGALTLEDGEGPGAVFELHLRRLGAIDEEARGGHRREQVLLELAAR
jgi:signal transduction histidine kinase